MEITPSGMGSTISTVPIEENDLMDALFPTITPNPTDMDTTLSTFPIEGNDLMDPSFPTLTIDPADLDLDNMTFTFDDDESANIWAFRHRLQDLPILDTGLQENNVAEEPTTVKPLATLVSDEHLFDSTTCPDLSNYSASEREDSVSSQYTPPTPISKSPSLERAPIMPPAPVGVTSQAQHQMPRDPTAEEIELIAQHLHNEWISLNQHPSTPNPPPAHIIVEIRPEGRYPRQVPVYYPMHYHEHTTMPGPQFGQFYPAFPPMRHPIPPTYPMPPRTIQPPPVSPVSNKRTFEFVEPEVPENFVANPNNHGRWQYDRHGNRHYLNAPKTKRARAN
jgi:hypothetical protein